MLFGFTKTILAGTQFTQCSGAQWYIFRFRSYLVTDVGRILDAKGGCMNFREA
jgi:hypothetical protein